MGSHHSDIATDLYKLPLDKNGKIINEHYIIPYRRLEHLMIEPSRPDLKNFWQDPDLEEK